MMMLACFAFQHFINILTCLRKGYAERKASCLGAKAEGAVYCLKTKSSRITFLLFFNFQGIDTSKKSLFVAEGYIPSFSGMIPPILETSLPTSLLSD